MLLSYLIFMKKKYSNSVILIEDEDEDEEFYSTLVFKLHIFQICLSFFIGER